MHIPVSSAVISGIAWASGCGHTSCSPRPGDCGAAEGTGAKKEGIVETDNTSAPVAASAETGSQKGSVGALLHATRLRLGVELGAVADALHIRVSYLEAIEAGDYESLPGGTYAVGFIRSYAEQLGLDGKEMVRRFKLETGTQPQLAPQPVSFPTPVKTLGLPVGSILTGVVVVAGLLFAAWYLLSGNESTTLLPKLPAALNETIDTPERPQSQAVAPAPVAPSAAPAPVVPAPTPTAPPPEAAKPAEPPKPVEPPQPAVEAPKPAPVVPPKPEIAKPAAPPPPVAPPKPETAKPVEPPKPAAEAPKPAAPPAPPPRPNVEESADGAPVGPETVARTARVYGEENAATRVELVATADSWVQVTENGSLVLTRLLHPGDRFRVPDRPGLTLMTGNAGGLDVVVDGGKVAPLGAAGQVVRDVPLDPERLRGRR